MRIAEAVESARAAVNDVQDDYPIQAPLFTGFTPPASVDFVRVTVSADGRLRYTYRPPLIIENVDPAGIARINILYAFRNPFEPWANETGAGMLSEREDEVVANELSIIRRALATVRNLAQRGLMAAAIPILATATPTAAGATITPPRIVDTLVPETEGETRLRRRLERARTDLKLWLGITQEDLAGVLGISPATLSNMCKTGRTPRASSTRALLRAYAISSEIRRKDKVAGEFWLRSTGLGVLRVHGIEALERAASGRLFPTTDRRSVDATVSSHRDRVLDENLSTDLIFEVERL